MPKSLKERLAERTSGSVRRSYETREETGRFQSIWKSDMPFPRWICRPGEHIIDIIPFEVATDEFPNATGKSISPGDAQHVMRIWVHGNVGPRQSNYVCPSRNYDLPCPICKHIESEREKEDYNQDQLYKWSAKQRAAYYVVVRDGGKEEQKGVQIYEDAFYFTEKNWAPMARIKSRAGGIEKFINFASPLKDEGKSITFEKKGKGQGNVEFTGHNFMDRDYDIEDKFLEKVAQHPFESLFTRATYDEIAEAHYGPEGGGEDHSEPFDGFEDDQQEEVTDDLPESFGGDAIVDPKCLGGGEWGHDNEKLKHCQKCESYDACATEYEKIAEEADARRAARVAAAPETSPARTGRRKLK